MTAAPAAPRRVRRRTVLRAGLALALAGVPLAACAAGPWASGRWAPGRLDRPVFGMLEAAPAQFAALRAAGVTAVVVGMAWSRAEPSGPGLDEGHLAEVAAMHRAARDAGLAVALDLGLQYPPGWVFDLPGGTRFVDQDGREWRAATGDDVPDAVFHPQVRAAQESYLRAVGAAFDGPVEAVRVGGLGRGELHYPHGDGAFWAFGPAARAASPVPDFVPGRGPRDEAEAFLDWYLGALAGYGRRQLQVCREAFGSGPRLLVLQPSWGVRPGEVAEAAAGGLDGSSRGERRGTLAEGVDWERQLPLFAEVDGVAVCSTWLDPPDQGRGDADVSPGVHLARLAHHNGLGAWGENTGDNDAAAMQRCLDRVDELGLEGLFWMGGAALGHDGNATLEDYGRLIAARRWKAPAHVE